MNFFNKISHTIISIIKSDKQLEYRRFANSLTDLYNKTPNINNFYEQIDDDYGMNYSTPTVVMKGTTSSVTQLLPIKSLRIKDIYYSIRKVRISFNEKEFKNHFNNPIDEKIITLYEHFISKNKNDQRMIYENNRETFDTLIDCMKQKIYLESVNDVIEIIEHLITITDEENSTTKANVKERLSFEIEFIRKQKENKEFLHNFQKWQPRNVDMTVFVRREITINWIFEWEWVNE